MPEQKIGIPKQSIYTTEELIEIFNNDNLPRGTFTIDSDGKGNYKVARIEKQWIQKLGGL